MIPRSVRIFVCTRPMDMRRSFDGLAVSVRQLMGLDPQSGALFMFINKRSNRTKILWFDRNGYCILYKRLHRALFRMPKSGDPFAASVQIDGVELSKILEGISLPTRKIKRTFSQDIWT